MSEHRTIQPLGERVAVKLDAAESIRGGIIVPESAQKRATEGVVIALGKKDNGQPFCVKVGDRVLVPRYSGSEVKVDGEAVQLFREADLLAVRED